MLKVALVAALLVVSACTPQAEEEVPPVAEQPMAAPAPADSLAAPSDTMARDTTSG